jgi:hypothetical protein
MRARFKLRSLVTLIAVVALALAVAAVSMENRRLRRELKAAQQSRLIYYTSLDAIDLSAVQLFMSPKRRPPAPAEHMPDSLDAFANPTQTN